MNLIEVRDDLLRSFDNVELMTEKRNDNNIKISKWMNMSNILHSLKKYSFLEEQVDEIFSIDETINIRKDTWIATPDTYNKLVIEIGKLTTAISSCINLISEHVGEEPHIAENSRLLNVKMPDSIDMKKMSSICNDIDIVFEQCPLIKDEVKFVGVEKGSVYFLFTTAVPSVIAIGLILNVALDVQKKYYHNQMVKSKLETMKDVEESTQTIIKKLDDEVEEYCKIKAREVEGAANLKPEEQTRLILSIKTLHELIGKGVQMQCLLCEGESDPAISFPKVEEFTKLLETIKLIEQK